MRSFSATRTRHAERVRRDLLTTTALTMAVGIAATGSAFGQAYQAGGGTAGGTNATAVGPNANASGNESFAGGYNASALGLRGVAIGSGASADSAVNDQGIIDYRTTPNGTYPVQNEPNGTLNVRPSGTAIGDRSTVGTGGGVSIGYNNRAGVAPGGGGNAFSSTAIGTNNNASGGYAIGIGTGNLAQGVSAISIGTANQALGDRSVALGRQSYAIGDNSFAQGFRATAGQNGTYMGYTYGAIAIGQNAVAGANTGGTTLAIGDSATATAPTNTGDSIAIGTQSSAIGLDSLAIGAQTTASGANTIAIGNNSTNNAGNDSIVIGVGSAGSAAAARSVVLGNNAAATVSDATALGQGAGVTVAGGVALGRGSLASRAGLNGATEAFSGSTVSSALGAVSLGSAGNERQITNLAGGTSDTDAVNLRQLRGVGTGLAATLGGSYNSAGAYTAPSYAYAGSTYNTVPGVVGAIGRLGLRYDADGSGNPLANVDLTRGGVLGSGSGVGLTGLADGAVASGSRDAVNGGQLYTTNQNVTANADDLTALRGSLDAGTVGLVRQNGASRTITVGSATDGTLVDLTGTAGARRLTGLAAGTGDADAVNLGQLRLSGNALAQGLGAGSAYNPATGAFTAPNYAVGGRTYGDVGSALSATNRLAVQYVPDGSGNPTGIVDLARGNGGNPAALRGVSAGNIAAGSTDAVNGDQLYATNLRIATNTTDIATNATSLSDLRQGLTDGTVGLVRQDQASRAIRVAAATDGALVDFRNNAGNGRVLRGVSAGTIAAGSDEAVNGSQLYDTNRTIAANNAATGDLRGAIGTGTIGLVQQDQITRDIAIGGATDGSRLTLRNAGGGTRLLTGLGDGAIAAGSTDAVNGGQLYATNDAVATNAAGLSAANGNLASLQTGIMRGTIGLLQQDQASRTLSIGSATDGTVLALANAGGTSRTVSGVAAGTLSAASTEAVNGSQLYATNEAVAGLSAGVANGTVGLVQQDPTTGGLTVGSGTDGTTVSFADRNGTARALTGVAGAEIAYGSTQAVNGGQVYGLSASLAQSLGGGATVATDGSVTAPSYGIQGSRFGDVGSALGSLDAAVTNLNTVGSRYVAVRSTGAAAQATGTDSVAIGPASMASADGGVALGANSVARRAGLSGASEAFSGFTVASTAGAVSVGADGAERQIVNVAGGTQDTDAINLRQLRAAGSNLAGALGGGAGFAADGSFTGPTYAIGGKSYSGVGDALAAVDTFAVKYDIDPATGGRGQSLTLAGSDPNQPVLIRNVAAGILPTDAANVWQVTAQVATARAESFAYTDQKVQAGYAASTAYTDARVAPLEKQMTAFGSQLAGLRNEVGQVRQEARRGAAIGLAAASLRFDDRPGKLSMAAGGGVWRGESAAAMGIGYSLPDGSARVNATGVAAGRDFGIGAGASFTLN